MSGTAGTSVGQGGKSSAPTSNGKPPPPPPPPPLPPPTSAGQKRRAGNVLLTLPEDGSRRDYEDYKSLSTAYVWN